MKIWGDVPKVSGAYEKQKSVSKVEKTASVKAKKDVLSISTQAKDYQSVVRTAKETPDIRQDKVDEILKRFETGSYNVQGKEVADKIVKCIIDKKV